MPPASKIDSPVTCRAIVGEDMKRIALATSAGATSCRSAIVRMVDSSTPCCSRYDSMVGVTVQPGSTRFTRARGSIRTISFLSDTASPRNADLVHPCEVPSVRGTRQTPAPSTWNRGGWSRQLRVFARALADAKALGVAAKCPPPQRIYRHDQNVSPSRASRDQRPRDRERHPREKSFDLHRLQAFRGAKTPRQRRLHPENFGISRYRSFPMRPSQKRQSLEGPGPRRTHKTIAYGRQEFDKFPSPTSTEVTFQAQLNAVHSRARTPWELGVVLRAR